MNQLYTYYLAFVAESNVLLDAVQLVLTPRTYGNKPKKI